MSQFEKSVFGYNRPDLAAKHSPFVTVSHWIQLLMFHTFRSNLNDSISKETPQTDSLQEYQKGQILLIVVLVMVTALTVGLSVVARSITDKKTSQESANSEKAFSAAEAGIERSLSTTSNTTYNTNLPNNTKFNANVSMINGKEFPLNDGQPVLKDDGVALWLSTYPTYATPRSGFITFYWGTGAEACRTSEVTNTMAALELVAISGSAANPRISHFAYDPCRARRLGNNLAAPGGGGTIGGVAYRHSATINLANGLFVQATPLYAPSNVAVSGCNAGGGNCTPLPDQGSVIQAIGTADNTQRKLISFRFYPQLPTELFQYSLFAPQ